MTDNRIVPQLLPVPERKHGKRLTQTFMDGQSQIFPPAVGGLVSVRYVHDRIPGWSLPSAGTLYETRVDHFELPNLSLFSLPPQRHTRLDSFWSRSILSFVSVIQAALDVHGLLQYQ